MAESQLTAVEILALGRATFAERLEQGETTAAALDAALQAVIAAEREACLTVAREWIDTGGRYGFTGDQAAKRIAEELGDRVRP